MKCELCGSQMKLRERLSGEKQGHRYWICENYPQCDGKKFYAEQGKPVGAWEKVGRLFVKK